MTGPDASHTSLRLDRLRADLREAQLDGLLVTSPVNVRYLTSSEAEALLVTQERAVIATKPRLARMLAVPGAGRIGFEARHTTVDEYERWQRLPPIQDATIELVGTRRMVERLRELKGPEERAQMADLGARVDELLVRLRLALEPSMSEVDAARLIGCLAYEVETDGLSTWAMVAAGDNASAVLIRPTQEPLGHDAVVAVFAVSLNGYVCEVTRTWSFRPHAALRAAHETVARCAREAGSALRAGLLVSSLCKKITTGLRAHRLEPPKYALGHAIGLELHERPYLFADVAEPLHEHAALVIEPSGRIGDRVARVGDTWLVEAAGGRDLTSAARSLDIR